MYLDPWNNFSAGGRKRQLSQWLATPHHKMQNLSNQLMCCAALYLKKMIFYSPADDVDFKLCVALTQIIIPWNQGIHPKSATVSPPAQIPTPPCVTLTLLTEMTSPCLKMPSEIELAPPYKLLTLPTLLSLLILLKTAAYLPIYIAIWFNQNVVICRDTQFSASKDHASFSNNMNWQLVL